MAFPYPEGMFTASKQTIDQILWTIRTDGPFVDDNGSAVSRLEDALNARGIEYKKPMLSVWLREMDNPEGSFGRRIIKRELAGKRTYKLSLQMDPDSPNFPPAPEDFDTTVRYTTDVEEPEDTQLSLDAAVEEQSDAEATESEVAPAANGNGHDKVLADTVEFPSGPVGKLFTALALINDVAIEMRGSEDVTELQAQVMALQSQLAAEQRKNQVLVTANGELRRSLASTH